MKVEAKGWYELNAPFHYTVSFEVSISDWEGVRLWYQKLMVV